MLSSALLLSCLSHELFDPNEKEGTDEDMKDRLKNFANHIVSFIKACGGKGRGVRQYITLQ